MVFVGSENQNQNTKLKYDSCKFHTQTQKKKFKFRTSRTLIRLKTALGSAPPNPIALLNHHSASSCLSSPSNATARLLATTPLMGNSLATVRKSKIGCPNLPSAIKAVLKYNLATAHIFDKKKNTKKMFHIGI